jgi:hypothetical protein
LRVREPALIDRITIYQTLDPQPSRKLLELTLGSATDHQGNR